MSDEDKKERGRPSSYKPEFAKQAQKLCSLGATNPELAEFFGISLAGFKKWLAVHQDLVAALKVGKAQADDRVERSLYGRAMGYSHEAVKIFMPAGASEPVYAPYTEHVPPDVTACIFWLKNRRPDLWRDKSEHIVRHEVEQMMTDAELQRIAAEGVQRITATARDPSRLN